MVSKTRRKSAGGEQELSSDGEQVVEEDTEAWHFQALRFLVLLLLTIQNCSLMMVTSYSRSLPGPRYLASTAVVAAEILKTVTLVSVLLYQNGFCGMQGLIWTDILSRDSGTTKFAIPAFFYTIQNNLWYYAMSNLDPVTGAVTSQLKVLTTALFSVVILQKTLTRVHWSALCLLVIGLSVMQLKPERVDSSASSISSSIAGSSTSGNDPFVPGSSTGSYVLGLLAMVAACTSSGFAGVYLERVLKELDSNIWIANMQLQCFCMPIAVLTVLSDMPDMYEGGVLVGWNSLTIAVVSLNGLGGLLVTATMKYADNIMKTFAVSMSLVLNCLLSWFFMSVSLLLQDMLGVVVVIAGTWLYNLGSTPIPTSTTSGPHLYVKVGKESPVAADDIESVPIELLSPDSEKAGAIQRMNMFDVSGWTA
mmetsp:Transcript_565/g.1363  ORF Transcript_565/g.1363 Transcript_565/m.1363 type:complete len:421 (+) Transcript_565:183-1445(+)